MAKNRKMKKLLSILFILSICLSSCNRDKIKLNITDFSKTKTVTLKPYKWYPYAMLKIRVKGYTNDTIRLNYNLYGNTNFYVSGDIDTLLVQTDYYGEGPVTLTFDPYKATDGKLEIDFGL